MSRKCAERNREQLAASVSRIAAPSEVEHSSHESSSGNDRLTESALVRLGEILAEIALMSEEVKPCKPPSQDASTCIGDRSYH